MELFFGRTVFLLNLVLEMLIVLAPLHNMINVKHAIMRVSSITLFCIRLF